MHFSTLLNAAVVILSFTDVSSAHVVFADAYGNASPAIRGFGLGFHGGTVRKGFAQWPQQRDIAVFNQRPVHTGWWKGATPQGCGTSILSVTTWYQKHQPAKWSGKGVTDAKRKWLWTQSSPAGGYIDIKANTDWLANSEAKKGLRVCNATGRKNLRNGIPKVTAGGTLNIMAWQVNLDGGGNFKCRLDVTGSGKKFTSAWLKVTKNCAGNKASFNVAGIQKACWFTVALPANLNCGGAYGAGGSAKNICMVRCENSAKNGPFGGCVPIQQVKPVPKPLPKPIIKVITVKPPPQTIVVTQPTTVVVTKGHTVVVSKGDTVTVTQPKTITVTVGQVVTITTKGTTRVSTCTKKGVITITNEVPVTVTQKSTLTVTDKTAVTVTEAGTVTITQPAETKTTVVSEAEAEAETEVPASESAFDDANKPEATVAPTGTRTLTPEELEAAKGGEEFDPEDLEDIKKEKIDDETKEDLKEEAESGGKSAEPLPEEEVGGYY